jgi:hypothetical protein
VQQAASQPKRPWSVTANALLLVLESAGCVLMGALHLVPLGVLWPMTEALWNTQRAAVVTGFIFALLATLALAAAVGFMRVASGAWLLAVLVQGINLALALVLYFEGRPAYVYMMMLYGIVMVLYLHQDDVQAAFRRAGLDQPEAALAPPDRSEAGRPA